MIMSIDHGPLAAALMTTGVGISCASTSLHSAQPAVV
jgi:hypothetical protein